MDVIQHIRELFTAETGIRTAEKGKNKLDVYFNTGKEGFITEFRNEIREVQLPVIFQAGKEETHFIVFAGKTYPKTRLAMRKVGVNYMDAAGNIFIHTEKVHIHIENTVKTRANKPHAARAFTKTGCRVVFHLLAREEDINLTVRELAGNTGVGNDTIHKVFANLLDLGFLLKETGRLYRLNRRDELIRDWIKAYRDKLRPAIFTGRYDLTGNGRNWKELRLQNGAFWGGEPAAALLTRHLLPAEWILYTDEPRAQVIRNYRLKPDPQGKMFVYRKFWQTGNEEFETAHPLLVYADLLITEEPRNIETAKLIYEQYIA